MDDKHPTKYLAKNLTELNAKMRIQEQYNSLAPDYVETYKEPMFIAEDDQTYAHMRARIKRLGNILDVGCSTGEVLRNIRKDIRPQQYTGIDISPGMIEQARVNYPDYNFVECDFLNYQTAQTFDTFISLYGTMNYINPAKAVSKIKSLMNKDGYIFVHYASYHRYHSSCVDFDNSLNGYYWFMSGEIEQLYRTKFSEVKIIKQNLLPERKPRLPVWLLTPLLKLDEHIPIPFQYYAWIIIIAKK